MYFQLSEETRFRYFSLRQFLLLFLLFFPFIGQSADPHILNNLRTILEIWRWPKVGREAKCYFNVRMKGARDRMKIIKNCIGQVVKMLVAVVVLFVICWGPILVDNMLTAYGYLPHVKAGTYKHLNTAFQLMAYFNR